MFENDEVAPYSGKRPRLEVRRLYSRLGSGFTDLSKSLEVSAFILSSVKLG